MKNASAWILLLCVCLLLCACGEKPESTAPAQPGTEAVPAPAVTALADAPAPYAAPEPEGAASPAPAAPTDPGARTVLFTRLEGDGTGGEGARIQGLDADGAVVWERVFSTAYCTELTPIEEIGLWQDRYYFNNNGVITCLGLADGALLWENGEFRGASISALIDPRNGSIYACGYYGPDFFAADARGNTLTRLASASEEFFWPGDMRWAGEDLLEARYFGGVEEEDAAEGWPYYVDLTDFSVSYYTPRIDVSENERYWANIFLSDFIEQNLTGFDAEAATFPADAAAFVCRFCRINRPELLVRRGEEDALSFEDARRISRRFFDRDLIEGGGEDRNKDYGADCRAEDGMLCFRPGEAQIWNRFALLREIRVTPEGRFDLRFDVYALNPAEYAARGMDPALYRLTPEQAEQLAGGGRIVRLGTGRALAVRYPDGTGPAYDMPSASVGYWLIRLETDLE